MKQMKWFILILISDEIIPREIIFEWEYRKNINQYENSYYL